MDTGISYFFGHWYIIFHWTLVSQTSFDTGISYFIGQWYLRLHWILDYHISSDYTGLPVDSEEICVCVAVECSWMHMDMERGKGGGESMRDVGKRRRHGLGG